MLVRGANRGDLWKIYFFLQNLPKNPIFEDGPLNFFFKWLQIIIANAFPKMLVPNI